MGLRNTIASAVAKAMVKLGDVPITLTYTCVVPGSYNVALDAMVNTTTVLSNVKALRYREKEEQQDYKRSTLNEFKLLIEASVFGNHVPNTLDFVTIGSVKYEVQNAKPDPSESVWIFVVRQS